MECGDSEMTENIGFKLHVSNQSRGTKDLETDALVQSPTASYRAGRRGTGAFSNALSWNVAIRGLF